MREIDELARAILNLAGHQPALAKARPKGWQQAGDLVVGGSNTVSMQFDFGEPDSYTIGFLPPFAFGNDPCVRAEALVMWNVDGAYKPVRVSVVGGQSVTGVAQGVKILITDATPITQDYCPQGTKYQVSAQVARGTRGTSVIAPYYIPLNQAHVNDLAAHSTSTVVVPYDAGVQSFYFTVTQNASGGTAPQVGDVLVSQQAQSPHGNGVPGTLGTFDPARFQGWVPMLPGCNQIVTQNASGNHYSYTLIFGIDG